MKKIVVIGSGLAGSLICNELANDADVTLLEIGKRDVITYPKINFIRKRLAESNTFCFSGGGGSNIWHNGLIPIGRQDVSSNEFSEILAEAGRYMDKAASKLFFTGSSYSSEYNNSVSEMSAIAKEIGVFDDGVDCLLYPKKFKKLTLDSNVNTYYSVDKVKFLSEGDKITKITFFLRSKEYVICPDVIVFSAGTFGTPKLVKQVLSSIGVNNENVGGGLIDHPVAFVGKVKFKTKIAVLMRKFASLDRGQYECCTGVRLKSDCGKYTCIAFFRPTLTMCNQQSIHEYMSLLGSSSGIERIKNAFSIKIFHPDILAEIFAHIFGTSIRGNTFNVLVYFQQRQGGNSVTYNDGKLNIDWSITDNEINTYNNILGRLEVALSSVSDEINFQNPITEEWLRSGAHHSGTISLGDGSEDLVDRNLKLKQCDNVYVCDGSIVQEHSYANTGLTIGQLSLRLAENIL